MSQLALSQRETDILRLLIAANDHLLDDDEDDIEPEPLTDREFEVLHLLACGLTNNQIAIRCTIELSTVKKHVSAIISKMRVYNSRAAVCIALTTRMITVDQLNPRLMK